MDHVEQPLDKIKNRLKELQTDNARLKERIEEIVRDRRGLVSKVETAGFKVGIQEATFYSEKHNLIKERQVKEEELKDWQSVLNTNKDDLTKKRDELKHVLEDLRINNASLNKTKEGIYEEFEKNWTNETQREKEEARKLEKAPKTLEEILAKIKVEKQGEVLTFNTLRQIFDGLAVYVQQTFCKLIDDYRVERRERNYNNSDFVEAFIEFEKKTKTLMGNKQQEFLDKLKVSSELLSKSINYHGSQGNREVLQLYPMLAAKLRGFKESDRNLEKEEVKAILNLKEKLIREKKDILVDLMKEGGKAKILPEQIFSLVQFRLSDDIAGELKIEEEDITKAMKTLDNIIDPDIQEVSMKVQTATHELLQSLVGEK